jgi:hypothetical protein
MSSKFAKKWLCSNGLTQKTVLFRPSKNSVVTNCVPEGGSVGRRSAQPAGGGHASLPAEPAGYEAGDSGRGRQVKVHLQHSSRTTGACGFFSKVTTVPDPSVPPGSCRSPDPTVPRIQPFPGSNRSPDPTFETLRIVLDPDPV